MKKANDLIWLLLALAAVAACALGIGEQTTAEVVDTLGRKFVEVLP